MAFDVVSENRGSFQIIAKDSYVIMAAQSVQVEKKWGYVFYPKLLKNWSGVRAGEPVSPEEIEDILCSLKSYCDSINFLFQVCK